MKVTKIVYHYENGSSTEYTREHEYDKVSSYPVEWVKGSRRNKREQAEYDAEMKAIRHRLDNIDPAIFPENLFAAETPIEETHLNKPSKPIPEDDYIPKMINYLHVEPDSQLYTDLAQLLQTMKYLKMNKGILSVRNIGKHVTAMSLSDEIDYIIKGLENSIAAGYKIVDPAPEGMITAHVPVGSYIVPPNETVTPNTRYRCLLCGRDKFTRKSPHKCRGGYRKRKIVWEKFGLEPIADNILKGLGFEYYGATWCKDGILIGSFKDGYYRVRHLTDSVPGEKILFKHQVERLLNEKK